MNGARSVFQSRSGEWSARHVQRLSTARSTIRAKAPTCAHRPPHPGCAVRSLWVEDRLQAAEVPLNSIARACVIQAGSVQQRFCVSCAPQKL
jgi:hypothetical protein